MLYTSYERAGLHLQFNVIFYQEGFWFSSVYDTVAEQWDTNHCDYKVEVVLENALSILTLWQNWMSCKKYMYWLMKSHYHFRKKVVTFCYNGFMTYHKKRGVLSTKSRKIFRFTVKFLIILFVIVDLLELSTLHPADHRNTNELAVQVETTKEYDFIRTIAPYAQETQEKYGILASLTLGQAALESYFGRSGLAAKYYNLFGIKAYGNVPKVALETKEFENNQWITVREPFRVYDNWQQSVEGHAFLFTEGTTWNPNQYALVLAAKDYKEAAHAVQLSGYATDPAYTERLLEIIENYSLFQYDKV